MVLLLSLRCYTPTDLSNLSNLSNLSKPVFYLGGCFTEFSFRIHGVYYYDATAVLHQVRGVQGDETASRHRGGRPLRGVLLLWHGALRSQEDAQLPSHGQATEASFLE